MTQINNENKQLYDKYKDFHTNDGGKHPDAYAITELIKHGITYKNYKIYNGGGCDVNGEPVKNYDVVVSFTFGGDPLFRLCIDNSEGDACRLAVSDAECKFNYYYF